MRGRARAPRAAHQVVVWLVLGAWVAVAAGPRGACAQDTVTADFAPNMATASVSLADFNTALASALVGEPAAIVGIASSRLVGGGIADAPPSSPPPAPPLLRTHLQPCPWLSPCPSPQERHHHLGEYHSGSARRRRAARPGGWRRAFVDLPPHQ